MHDDCRLIAFFSNELSIRMTDLDTHHTSSPQKKRTSSWSRNATSARLWLTAGMHAAPAEADPRLLRGNRLVCDSQLAGPPLAGGCSCTCSAGFGFGRGTDRGRGHSAPQLPRLPIAGGEF